MLVMFIYMFHIYVCKCVYVRYTHIVHVMYAVLVFACMHYCLYRYICSMYCVYMYLGMCVYV